jgi:hypothetical protein
MNDEPKDCDVVLGQLIFGCLYIGIVIAGRVTIKIGSSFVGFTPDSRLNNA